MKIIACHIENFGKFHDKTFQFSDGLNYISKPNGWGKSTLAEFLKVIFYGFDGETKRDEIENRRKRFRPWQGGVYGGSVTIEHGGRILTITRTFGNKEKEDFIEIYDEERRENVPELLTDTGEKLFGIDSESFGETLFINQGDLTFIASGATLHKLSDPSEEQHVGDIDNYEKAMAKLDAVINKLSPTRKTGQVYKLSAEMARLKAFIAGEKAIKEAIRILSDSDEKKNGGPKIALFLAGIGIIAISVLLKDNIGIFASVCGVAIGIIFLLIAMAKKLPDDNESEEVARKLGVFYERMDEINEAKEELANISSRYEEDKQRYEHYVKTREYLSEAKKSYTGNHIGPVNEAYNRFYNMLTMGEGHNPCRLDSDFNLSVYDKGVWRDPSMFSSGTKDLMGLCLRMAFIDGMYSGEKPMIIMDDPMVMFDDRRRDQGMRFLENIAGDYQILYFTCREDMK